MNSPFVQSSCCSGFIMNVSGCGSTILYLKMGFRKHKMSKMLVVRGSENAS